MEAQLRCTDGSEPEGFVVARLLAGRQDVEGTLGGVEHEALHPLREADARAAGDEGGGPAAARRSQADGGKDAWLFLAAGFVVEALVWGEYFI